MRRQSARQCSDVRDVATRPTLTKMLTATSSGLDWPFSQSNKLLEKKLAAYSRQRSHRPCKDRRCDKTSTAATRQLVAVCSGPNRVRTGVPNDAGERDVAYPTGPSVGTIEREAPVATIGGMSECRCV